jgi:hypothetical protein
VVMHLLHVVTHVVGMASTTKVTKQTGPKETI